MEPNEILKRPYARVLTPEPDGQVTAEIMEFPGCVTYGRDSTEALSKLEKIAVDWIGAALEQGQDIPEPMAATDFSGKLVLRMTKGLHRRAALCADREGVSLNQFIVTCVAECVGERAKPQPVLYPVPHFELTGTFSFKSFETSAVGNSNMMASTGGAALLPVSQQVESRLKHA